VELESQRDALKRRGLGLAAVSYDSVAILKDFATRKKIAFPLLSDPESRVIRAFGILNEADYPPGQLAHGVPYPGTFVIDAQAVVRYKFFEKTYPPWTRTMNPEIKSLALSCLKECGDLPQRNAE